MTLLKTPHTLCHLTHARIDYGFVFLSGNKHLQGLLVEFQPGLSLEITTLSTNQQSTSLFSDDPMAPLLSSNTLTYAEIETEKDRERERDRNGET